MFYTEVLVESISRSFSWSPLPNYLIKCAKIEHETTKSVSPISVGILMLINVAVYRLVTDVTCHLLSSRWSTR